VTDPQPFHKLIKFDLPAGEGVEDCLALGGRELTLEACIRGRVCVGLAPALNLGRAGIRVVAVCNVIHDLFYLYRYAIASCNRLQEAPLDGIRSWPVPLGQPSFEVVAVERARPDHDAGACQRRSKAERRMRRITDPAPAGIVLFDHAMRRWTVTRILRGQPGI
jgi:hypothetical protein